MSCNSCSISSDFVSFVPQCSYFRRRLHRFKQVQARVDIFIRATLAHQHYSFVYRLNKDKKPISKRLIRYIQQI